MSHLSSILTRLEASDALSATRERVARHPELIAVLVFTALVLTALLAALLAHNGTRDPLAAPAPAPTSSAPATLVPTAAAKPRQAPGARPEAARPPASRQQSEPSAPQPPRPGERTYRVRPGDTLVSIAQRHGVDYRRIALENRLANPNLIHPGQTLRIGPPTPGIRFARPGGHGHQQRTHSRRTGCAHALHE